MATTYFQSLVVLYISLIHGDFSCKKVHISALFTPFGYARSYISCVFWWCLFNRHLGYPLSTSMVPYCFHCYFSKGDTFIQTFLRYFGIKFSLSYASSLMFLWLIHITLIHLLRWLYFLPMRSTMSCNSWQHFLEFFIE